MKEYTATVIERATGRKVYYLYKDTWSSRYYSFDEGATWNHRRGEAYRHAASAGKLKYIASEEVKA